MQKKLIVIGSGFAGLSAATFMAKAGWDVTLIEKNKTPGGRARQLKADGFTFDMGPSWYWMADVFDRYFAQFGKKVSDYYSLKRLDPSYRVYWPTELIDIPADLEKFKQLLESWESGSAARLDKFLLEAAYKYRVGMQKLVLKPGLSAVEFLDWEVVSGIFKLDIFTSIKKHIHKSFSDSRIRQLLEFPVLFLGALPENTPALYSLMNYADIVGGTWYPQGGMYAAVDAMHQLAIEMGVKFKFDEEVTAINITNNRAEEVVTIRDRYKVDAVIGGADYHHVEQHLLLPQYRTYSEKYWQKRQLAPSCLLYYVGLNKRLNNLQHHMLFFDVPFDQHAHEIYTSREWPKSPLFYVSASSVTDPTVAPPGCENLFFLIPVAAGLENDDEAVREKYFHLIISRFERRIGQPILDSVVYKKSYGYSDFVNDYHSFRGNAYGLANTLFQTAIFRPKCRSSKVRNLFYTGQLTVPGPGVPPSLISGEVVARELQRSMGEK
ncbi:MAG: phytoene desaturase [Chitinophagaceae bacterium]|nr:phytoene desaturase [Chitinophagaceae bacterium]